MCCDIGVIIISSKISVRVATAVHQTSVHKHNGYMVYALIRDDTKKARHTEHSHKNESSVGFVSSTCYMYGTSYHPTHEGQALWRRHDRRTERVATCMFVPSFLCHIPNHNLIGLKLPAAIAKMTRRHAGANEKINFFIESHRPLLHCAPIISYG